MFQNLFSPEVPLTAPRMAGKVVRESLEGKVGSIGSWLTKDEYG